MKPLFEMPVLENLSGESFTGVLSTELGFGDIICTMGCASGCVQGSGGVKIVPK